jgi:hypothetical protein
LASGAVVAGGRLERWHTSFSRRLRSLASSALSTAPLTQSTDARSRRVAITSAAEPETAHLVMSVGSGRRAAACVGPVGGRLEGPAMRRLLKRTGCESNLRLREGGCGASARNATRGSTASATRPRVPRERVSTRTRLPGSNGPLPHPAEATETLTSVSLAPPLSAHPAKL